MTLVEQLAQWLWQPRLLALFLFVGLYCTLKSGCFQFFGFKVWLCGALRGLFQKNTSTTANGTLTPSQALSTALASTIGTGSIAGVATAIFYGGPGAVFWMWVSAWLGLMTGFVEKVLAVKYRQRAPNGEPIGGPMIYLEQKLGWKLWAKWFSFWCVLAALSGGAMVQSNSITAALRAALGGEKLFWGILTAFIVGVIIFGGLGRVGRLSERLVPLMALLFLGSATAVILAHRDRVLPALQEICVLAWNPQAVAGGIAGYEISTALRYGVARGVFTNEAGVGSSAIAHAAVRASSPAEEGFRGMFEVFFATCVICTATALAILTSGVYCPQAALQAIQTGTVTDSMTGAPLAGAAFATLFGQSGYLLIAISLFLFAFTSLLGWCCYGEQALIHLTHRQKLRNAFRLLFLVTVIVGSMENGTEVWALSDICNGLMALPNLFAILRLTPEALKELKKSSRLL